MGEVALVRSWKVGLGVNSGHERLQRGANRGGFFGGDREKPELIRQQGLTMLPDVAIFFRNDMIGETSVWSRTAFVMFLS